MLADSLQITEYLTKIEQIPSYLLSGQHEKIAHVSLQSLQKFFCENQGCTQCFSCIAINEHTHYAITWLKPDNQYTVEQVRYIHEKTTLQLQPDEHHIIVLEHAERLNLSSSNSLLKLLEEPPARYHIWLLTSYPEKLLRTLRSRCIHVTITSASSEIKHPFITVFSPPFSCSPKQFAVLLKKELPSETESPALLEQITKHWKSIQQKHIHTILTKAIIHPPISGNSKLFWRNLYMQLHHAIHQRT